MFKFVCREVKYMRPAHTFMKANLERFFRFAFFAIVVAVASASAAYALQSAESEQQAQPGSGDLPGQAEPVTRFYVVLGVAGFLLALVGVLYYRQYTTRLAQMRTLEQQNAVIREKNEQIEVINKELQQQIVLRRETDETINYFATSLFGKNTLEEILWDVAKNCISRLGLIDCVIYLLDQDRNVLVQKAAYGTKNPYQFEIQDPIEIPLGQGIVGSVAERGVAEIVNDTSKDPRYIVDDEVRYSELAVPLMIQNKVIGIIDSEHPEKNFFTDRHLEALTTIASICSSKIMQSEAHERESKARETEREAEQIKELDQLKSQFFANISHEFRTPLNLILAPLQRRQPLSLFEMEMMERSARRLLTLVNQLLDLARVEGGMLPTQFSCVNIFGFITEVGDSFALIAVSREIAYRMDVPAYDHIGYTDADKLEKIVCNLLSNAFKFTPKGGRVRLAASVVEGSIEIRVQDNGVGIPKHLHDKVFSHFFQVEGLPIRAYEGSGIGLALTHELVTLLGGNIAIISDEGRGCEFCVTLPLNYDKIQDNAEPDDTSSSVPAVQEMIDGENATMSATGNAQAPIVLIVEDNVDLREYLGRCLSPKYHVLLAADGEQGLLMAQENIPDLIISDVMMPKKDGVGLTASLRTDETTSHIPIILLTARDDIETKIKAFISGAEQYLVKPFEIDELVARMEGLLERQERLSRKFAGRMLLEPSEVVVPDRDAAFLAKAMQVIESGMFEKSFSVEQLHTGLGMSRMQLHRKLKSLTRQSAGEFVRTIRLKRAAQMLQQPGVQIAEVAYQCGFNHLSYFSKCFKEQFGTLPSDYVKSVAAT